MGQVVDSAATCSPCGGVPGWRPRSARREVEDVLDGRLDGLGGVGDIVVGPGGTAVYTTAQHDSAVAALRRDPSTGALQFRDAIFNGNGVSGLGSAAGLAISPDSACVYVAGFDDNAVAVFAVE